jgi:two-component system, NtrC family, response regulator AtoC
MHTSSSNSEGPGDRAMVKLREVIARVACSDLPVLFLGESGVGKSALAFALHKASTRRERPFLALNCAAFSESLLESELFGHERGAFTGAVQAKAGLLESAVGGTVLLDEIGELPYGLQAKLLQVLERRAVMRVGGLNERPLDVRFVSATNVDLGRAVAEGRFRADLFYRLDGISLVVPPLRERPSELMRLALAFCDEAARAHGLPQPVLSPGALQKLVTHPWPGNLRELKNALARAVVLSHGKPIEADDLWLAPALAPLAPPAGAEGDERDELRRAMEACAGNQTRAARLMGVSRQTLVRRLERYGFARPRLS